MSISKWLMGLLLAASGLAAVQAQPQTPELVFEHAWIRSAPPSAPVRAGYVSIHNPARVELTIASVESSDFGSTELHEMRSVDGVMRMRALRSLPIEPEGRVTLAPGGLHLMLMRPLRELAPGDRVELVFVLADGRRQRVAFEVRSDAPTAE